MNTVTGPLEGNENTIEMGLVRLLDQCDQEEANAEALGDAFAAPEAFMYVSEIRRLILGDLAPAPDYKKLRRLTKGRQRQVIEEIERDDILVVNTLQEAAQYPMFRPRQIVSSHSLAALRGRRLRGIFVTQSATRSPRWFEFSLELQRANTMYGSVPIEWDVRPEHFTSV